LSPPLFIWLKFHRMLHNWQTIWTVKFARLECGPHIRTPFDPTFPEILLPLSQPARVWTHFLPIMYYNINQAQNIPHLQTFLGLMQNPQAANHPQVAGILANLLPPSPQYTCPTCREPVHSRPTEAFALKAIVRVITAATGENSPKKPIRKGNALAAGPWDGFFPPKKT